MSPFRLDPRVNRWLRGIVTAMDAEANRITVRGWQLDPGAPEVFGFEDRLHALHDRKPMPRTGPDWRVRPAGAPSDYRLRLRDGPMLMLDAAGLPVGLSDVSLDVLDPGERRAAGVMRAVRIGDSVVVAVERSLVMPTVHAIWRLDLTR